MYTFLAKKAADFLVEELLTLVRLETLRYSRSRYLNSFFIALNMSLEDLERTGTAHANRERTLMQINQVKVSCVVTRWRTDFDSGCVC